MGVDLGSAWGSIEISTEGAQASVQSLASSLRSTGKTLSLAVSAPLVGVGTAALLSAAGFEQSLNVMQQVSGATATQMEALQATALQLGAETSFSAGEAASAMLELAKAGLSVDEVQGAIAGTLDLAAAGGLGLAQAAEIAANAVNTFGMDATQTSTVANMLAAAANASSVEVTDLAQGMQMAGAVFASNGQSVQSLTAALGLLGNAGIKGSDAGTSLKTMLMRLAAPTDDAAAMMERLSLNVYNADGSMRPFGDIVGDLSTSTADLSDQQRNMALSIIFGADAIRAATILADEGADGFGAMADAVGEEGAAADVANARMKGMAGAIEYLKGSIDSFLIGAALPFLDSLGGIVRASADAITAFGSMPQPMINAGLAFGAVLAAAGPVTMALSAVGTVIAALLSPLGLIVLAVGALAAAFATDFLGVRTVTVQAALAIQQRLMMIGAALRQYLTTNEVQRFAGQMQGAFAKVVTAARDLATGQSDVGSFVEKVKGAFGSIDWSVVTGPFDGLRTKVTDAFTAIATYDYGAAFGALRDAVVAKVAGLDWAPVTSGFAALRSTVVGAVTGIDWMGAFSAAVDAVNGVRDGVIGWLAGAIGGINWQGMSLDFAGMVASVTAKLQSIDWSTVNPLTLFAPLASHLAGKFGPVVSAVKWVLSSENFGGLVASVQAALTAIDWGAIGTALLGLVESVKQAIVGLNWGALTEAAEPVRAAVQGLFDGMQLNIKVPTLDTSTFSAAAAAVQDTMAPAFERLQAALATVPGSLEQLRPNIEGLVGAFGSLWNAIQPVVNAIGQALVIASVVGTNVMAAAIQRLPGIVGPMIDQVTASINMIATTVTGVTGAITAIATGDWAGAWESLKSIVTGFETFVKQTWTNVTTYLSNIGAAIGEGVVNTLNDLGLTEAATTIEAIITSIGTLQADIAALFSGEKSLFGEDGVLRFETPEWLAGFLAWTWPGLPEWTWPGLPEWTWPGLPEWEWPVFPKFEWPEFPTFEFPEFETPGWVQGLIDALNKFKLPWMAEGSNLTPGGLTWVGERGPELVVMPPGAEVLTNGQSRRATGGESRTININFGGVTVGSELDVHTLGWKLAGVLEGFGV